MSTVKNALAQKRGALIHVRSSEMVVEALRQMRTTGSGRCWSSTMTCWSVS
jgi:hypothetical protein